MSAGRYGKQYAMATILSTRTGTPVSQILRMLEEGGTFTLANGETILFVTPMEPLPGERFAGNAFDSYGLFR